MNFKIHSVIFFAISGLAGCVETEDQPQVVQCELSEYQREFMRELNDIRRTPKFCGDTFFISAPPVSFSCQLEPASEIHSLEMAFSGIVRHVGSNGVGLYGRMAETDYPWMNAGEAIASGSPEPGAILNAMVSESRNCRVMMEPSFYDASVTRVITDSVDELTYWTLVMANR